MQSEIEKYREKARILVTKMTIEEMADLVSGFLMWETKGIERLGIEKVDMSDGPHGIRKQLDYYNIAYTESVKTVGFPAGCCIASSWNREALA